MPEFKAFRMQHQPEDASHRPVFSVQGISHDGMPKAKKMHANLVAPPGQGPDVKKRRSFEGFADFKFRAGGLPLRMNAYPSGPEGAQRLIHTASVLDRPLREDPVPLDDLAVFELHGKKAVGFRILREENNPAGAAVQAMDHIDFPARILFQFRDEGLPGQIAASRDHDLAGGLGNRKKMRIFKKDGRSHVRKNL